MTIKSFNVDETTWAEFEAILAGLASPRPSRSAAVDLLIRAVARGYIALLDDSSISLEGGRFFKDGSFIPATSSLPAPSTPPLAPVETVKAGPPAQKKPTYYQLSSDDWLKQLELTQTIQQQAALIEEQQKLIQDLSARLSERIAQELELPPAPSVEPVQPGGPVIERILWRVTRTVEVQVTRIEGQVRLPVTANFLLLRNLVQLLEETDCSADMLALASAALKQALFDPTYSVKDELNPIFEFVSPLLVKS